jgi:hypothetical protein
VSYVPPEGTAIQVTLAGAYSPPDGTSLVVVLNPPESGYIFATTAPAVCLIEGTYIAPVLADMTPRTSGAACQLEGFHAPSVDADIDARTDDVAVVLSAGHIQFVDGDFDLVTEDIIPTLTASVTDYYYAALSSDLANAALTLTATHDFDLMHGVVTAPWPSIVGLVDMELPLNGTAFALRPEIDSETEATYQSYLQGLVLPVPTAYGTATYELTLQGVT